MNTLKAFSANLRRFRVARTLTQAQLAELAELNLQTISNYENGIRWPQADVLDLLAKALHVRPWQLFADEGEGGAIPPAVTALVAQLAKECHLKVSGTK